MRPSRTWGIKEVIRISRTILMLQEEEVNVWSKRRRLMYRL
jgi:hypothetical protein